jgi:hypothetical protein
MRLIKLLLVYKKKRRIIKYLQYELAQAIGMMYWQRAYNVCKRIKRIH